MRVLLVEDDAPLADATATGLRREGFAVDLATSGESAVERLAWTDYEVIVLDRNLPGVSGDHVCAELVAVGAKPRILMLSAAGDLDARVEGLTLGADDYLAKPFAMRELTARLRALGRRAARADPPVLTWGNIVVDTGRRRAQRADRPLALSNREFAVLETLVLAGGAVVSAEALIDRVWDERLDPFSNAVRVTLSTLRRKLGDPPVIETLRGVGYRLA